MIDGVLALEELVGFQLSNRPHRRRADPGVDVVLVADRFPAQDDPLVELALSVGRARVEAIARPVRIAPAAARALRIDYREDDGGAARAFALLRLALRHPARTVAAARAGTPAVGALATAAIRLAHNPGARVQALGGGEAERAATALARLSGRPLPEGEDG